MSTAVVLGIGAGLQLLSGSMGASAAREQGRAVAESELINASFAEQDARNTVLASRVEQERIQREARQKRGEIRANIAASGFITTDEGPLNLLAENAANEEREISRTMFEGEVRASRFLTEAELSRRKAKSAIEGAQASASGSLLGGGAGAFSIFAGAR